jgi:FixJ family two-component response regulator
MSMTTADALEEASAAVGPPLIAVVDDDTAFLRSLGRLLRSAGYRVAMYSSGKEFLSSLPASTPQCLVLDVHMPGLSGLDLHDQLAARGACVPLIFVTAYDTPQTREHACSPGSFGLLLKPFSKEALLRAITQALHSQLPDSGGPC